MSNKYILVATFDWYLFLLIMCLNPDFQTFSTIALSRVDKVATRTWSVLSVTGKAASLFILKIAQIWLC